MHKECTVSM